MFVRKSKFDEVLNFGLGWQQKYHHHFNNEYAPLAKKWSVLVERINALGGEEFLANGKYSEVQSQLSRDDIQRLLMLCHPDKHDGKQMATDMTTKLLKIRDLQK